MSNQDAFYAQLDLSDVTIQNYRASFRSKFLREYLETHYQVSSIFQLTDLEDLWKIYSIINLHPINVANHRRYSAAIMRYIRFLNNGRKYGKRIDYNKKKASRKDDLTKLNVT